MRLLQGQARSRKQRSGVEVAAAVEVVATAVDPVGREQVAQVDFRGVEAFGNARRRWGRKKKLLLNSLTFLPPNQHSSNSLIMPSLAPRSYILRSHTHRGKTLGMTKGKAPSLLRRNMTPRSQTPHHPSSSPLTTHVDNDEKEPDESEAEVVEEEEGQLSLDQVSFFSPSIH